MRIYSLNGEQWLMRQAGQEQWRKAKVPGSVYADLMRDGTLPDPFYRENELEAFALLENDFVYQRVFEAEETMLQSRKVLLRCEGLDTLAHVSLNGQPVGYADNMHITWEWDVKPLLLPGENVLEIRFDSPIRYALSEYEKRPGWCSTDAIPGFQHIRKAHCMFGWDWGPRLPDAGIWRPISLVCVNEVRLEDALILQEHRDGKVFLKVTPHVECEPGAEWSWSADLTTPEGERRPMDEDGRIVIEDPQLWWPAGYGEQPLYQVCVTVDAPDGPQQWKRRIGLRTLSISREKDQWGEEFCHIVNGVKVFAMGGDYIPEDNLLSRVTPQRTRRLLEDARLAHFNTVRIWGGGYYPDDFFYDICDELGLLVWQDFLYACAFYDLTPAFEASIRKETEQNVRRLRHHPSLALLCGNNEMEMFQAMALKLDVNGQNHAFVPSAMHHHADYIKMFESIIPEICRREAPQTFYWPASPSSGGSFDDPNGENRGDVHYWDVWHGEKPFTEYRKFFFRYTSEFGFQSFPCLKTVESFTLPEDRNIFSRVMERHQRNKAANGKILSYLSQTYRYPESFDNLLYASQLLQADAIRCGVEHWRRNRGRCMGAVIWQLNDCWPVASWSSIDYFGRWKALHYAARRFFAPVMISCQEEGEVSQNPQINEFRTEPIRVSARLCVSNETRETVGGLVRWALRTPDGAVVRQGEKTVVVPALSSRWLEEEAFPEASVTEHYLSYAFVVEGEAVSRGAVLFCAPKHFAFRNPDLRVSAQDGEITVEASAFAKAVYVESNDPDLLLSDNFFDMDPGIRKLQVLRGSAEGLRVRSVYDI